MISLEDLELIESAGLNPQQKCIAQILAAALPYFKDYAKSKGIKVEEITVEQIILELSLHFRR